ncbi:S9 family peptidase [Paracnuella aquatica]|uniref:S9 family peptidase n=1 Tax=Paracnuella aquatica TaxID=2268757 RepID=UPI000DEEF039|nr:S9 family peptidase [Paracnuella aquatica]RPD47317.1 S9 family peptidase [Paracnuella aquatica]
MRYTKILVAFLAIATVCQVAIAQSTRGMVWAKEGNRYYAIEDNGIVAYQLPAFTKTVVADSGTLKPAAGQRSIPIRSFAFSDDGKKVLLYTNTKKVWRLDTRGDYWVKDLASGTLKQLGQGRPASSLMFAKFSPDASSVAYVSEHNIFVEDLASGAIKQLTKDGTDRLINGTFDWAYEEEFDCRDGFRWSPNSKSIAYWQIDARQIRNFLMINNTDSVYSFTIPVEYPKVGEAPSPAKVGVVNIASGATTWMQVPGDPQQHYIPRMEWAANNTEIILEQLNRKQNVANIFICDAANGTAKKIYTENDNAWIDVKARWSDDFAGWDWLNGGKNFLWVSEKDGWRHIYLLDRNGKETLITKGDYDVISVNAIDAKNGYVYFMASPQNATQQYLHRISLKGGGKLEQLSPAAQRGTHQYRTSPDGSFAMHNFSNHRNERLSEWVQLPAHKSIKTLAQTAAGGGPNVEMFTITTEDGITMNGWMVKPKNFDSTKKYPVVFQVYAEPAGTTVRDAAGIGNNGLYMGNMADDGYIYMSVEGRGTPQPKGAAWRKSIYRKIGVINIRDQAMAAKKIRQWSFVDSSRIAVHGWSGGGSTTLNLLFQYPDIYQTGISIAPVPNQLLYDNIYQERYMGLPQENMEDFVAGSPITHAKNLKGNLLVVHGTGDDNVHYQGTEMLINELVKWGKQFQMMSYPNRTHSINEGEGTSRHLAGLFTKFLKEQCPGGPKREGGNKQY